VLGTDKKKRKEAESISTEMPEVVRPKRHSDRYCGEKVWRWIGHIERKSGDRLTKEAFRWEAVGKRRRGRPRQTWRRMVEARNAAGFSFGRLLQRASDRRKRQRLVAAVCAFKAQRD
jgi:hypothetical protein